MKDIEAGRVDRVVVYKVDCLAERYLVQAHDAAYTTVGQVAEQLASGCFTVFKRPGSARKAGLLAKKERKAKKWNNRMQQIEPTRGSGRRSA
jgi:hypothetical protein